MTDEQKTDSVVMAALFVRSARQSIGKSQADLAKEIGTSKNHVWRLERGTAKRGPTVELLARIARACGGQLKLTME
jgi:transcriptional regulator with XRE-family HTH domain